MWLRAGSTVVLMMGQMLPSAAATAMSAGFVYLRDIDPTITQDIRYAGPDNFIGQPLPGYEAAECVLREPVARALAAVQADLDAQGLGLKVYDCYRPSSAVRAMVSWTFEGTSDNRDEHFYPRVPKGALLAHGYIAPRSTHSTGRAVDLTLVSRGGSRPEPGPPGPCRAPADDSLDMGTTFDCFDPKAYTANLTIAAAARQHRMLLLGAMRRRGFTNYPREWWHFSFPGGANRPFDFPIVARE